VSGVLDEGVLGGLFDLVLFPGVCDHLRHILMSFDNIWRVLKPTGTVVVETHIDNHFIIDDSTWTAILARSPRRIPEQLRRSANHE
jgi:2-polyprenyl-3-methyl-5-hydroxy-6-metoxy-1,4-benzoquinol methylase